MSDLTGKTTGERIKHFRNRVGIPRPVLGRLVGHSAKWAMRYAAERATPETIRFNGYAKACCFPSPPHRLPVCETRRPRSADGPVSVTHRDTEGTRVAEHHA
jgi:hypothetical protein